MSEFGEFLKDRIEFGATSTEDVLTSFLPLARQVLEAHREGLVAPLYGVEVLQLSGVSLWYEEARNRPATSERRKVEALEKPASSAVEVLDEAKRTSDVGEGTTRFQNLSIGTRGEEVLRPVYLPGFASWEHEVGHHDPLTDIFSLGMLLASLACLLDFHQSSALETFVTHRRNLFRIAPDLHPVLAKAILRMTELRRHARASDLESLLHHLENYRNQDVDFGFDLDRNGRLEGETLPSKRRIVLETLQERLFEISKRNRLLHYRATMNSVNLTHASVPLSFDVRSIPPDQILTWSGAFEKDILADRPVALNKYLNFSEALYLPTVLDRIRTESQRDKAEFGFAQLFLVPCFLRWSNLKEKTPERFHTPLLLLPLELVRKKGIRDTYWLRAAEPEAEVNPVLRFYFKQLYNVELPERVDLSATSMDDLFESLIGLIHASEPAVHLVKVDRPRIDLIHDKARRRLDRYRRLRLSGRGVRTWLDVDYSYDPANFQPLGLQLFRDRIAPPSTHLKSVLQESPPARRFMSTSPVSEAVKETEKLFFSVREEAGDNPYNWELDLCNVSLGNFKYQKMTLVRDYKALLETDLETPSFDSIFSLLPDEVAEIEPEEVALSDGYQVVPCDPTQAAAIQLARAGASYIIQGPPGTGKSQTITNLIADFVAREKRVLFVCEKRAAIDVVFQRLQQQRLHTLCCLIHDAQADKKEFVMDLKRTYEGLRSEAATEVSNWEELRNRLHGAIERETFPIAHFHAAMVSRAESAAIPTRELLERAVAGVDLVPELDAAAKEALPDFADWQRSRGHIERLSGILTAVGGDVLARHPLARLDPALAHTDRPVDRLAQALKRAAPLLDLIEEALENAALGDDESWIESIPFADLESVFAYSAQIAELARGGLLPLLDRSTQVSADFDQQADLLTASLREAAEAASETTHWNVKLSAEEAALALERAQRFEGRWSRFLSSDWWQLRGVLRRHYQFSAHAIRPDWSHVLGRLVAEYEKAGLAAAASDAFGLRFNLPSRLRTSGDTTGTVEFIARIRDLRGSCSALSGPAAALHKSMLEGHTDADIIVDLADVYGGNDAGNQGGRFAQLQSTLSGVIVGVGDQSLSGLRRTLASIEESMESLPDFVHCLVELDALPDVVSSVLRRLALPIAAIEAAVVVKTLEGIYRQDRRLGHFDGTLRDQHASRLEALDQELQTTNARVVSQRVRRRFLDHLEIASMPAAQLSPEQKQFKSAYNRGRRELEHEFGKSMRYKPIRDLVAGDTSLVVRDLKPIWLMSPLSVSDTLPLDADYFDVVLFDEASQVTLEEAVPSIARAPQAIVVGDEMQLPPTNFFSARREEGEQKLWFDEEGEAFEYDLDSDSFLNHAARTLSSKMLGWHYRSRFESLISFSNWAFYQGNLLTVPERRRASASAEANRAEEFRAEQSADGSTNLVAALERPVSFHLMVHGVYDRRRNRAEAEYIAEMVRALLCRDTDEPRPSLAIVSFSEAQQDEIELALDRLAHEDREFRDRLEAEREREENDQFMGLLVKNLENIQGDERDIVIMSVCYGYGPDGRMRMNFGPINKSGGEKRLNVAFSRAKRNMILVSSIQYIDIKNDYNDGANCLKNYLRYAAASSVGDDESVRRVLGELALWRQEERPGRSAEDRHPVVEQLAAALEQEGLSVLRDLGQSRFRCDLAVATGPLADPELAIFVDHEAYYRQDNVLERDVLRPKLLRVFGWKTAHVLTKDWFENRRRVLDRILHRLAEGEAPEHTEQDLEDEAPDVSDEESQTEAAPLSQPPDPADGAREVSSESETLAGGSPASATRYFEFIGGSSRKFWEITVSGSQYSVRFGRLDTVGQELVKGFAGPEVAQAKALKVIAQKVAKGYVETING